MLHPEVGTWVQMWSPMSYLVGCDRFAKDQVKRFELGGEPPYELKRALQHAQETRAACPRVDVTIHVS
jgi:hypothetical protein